MEIQETTRRQITFEECQAYHYLEYCKMCELIRVNKGLSLKRDGYCKASCEKCVNIPAIKEYYESVLEGKEVVL